MNKPLKIGLIGEDPNDTVSIKNLLTGKYPNAFQFKQLIKNKRGDQLNNARVDAALNIELSGYDPDYILFIRDADGLPPEKEKIDAIKSWFSKFNSIIGSKGILLINIYEIEALILADIETFNKLYKTSIQFSKNCMHQSEPKEFLIEKTRKNRKVYSESHCPEIFKHLQYDVILAKCAYFKEFDTSIKKLIAS